MPSIGQAVSVIDQPGPGFWPGPVRGWIWSNWPDPVPGPGPFNFLN